MVDNDTEYAAILEELDRMVPDSDATLKFRVGYRRTGHLAHGWYARIRRTIEAILLLDQLNYAGEAAPLRRSVIEHNAALAWMAAEGDNVVDSVKHAHSAWLENQRRSLIDARWTSVDMAEFDEALASAAGGDSTRDFMRQAHQRLNRHDRSAFVGYFAETALSHATWSSAAAYIDFETGDRHNRPLQSVPQRPFAALQHLHSLHRFSELFEEVPWRDRLEALNNRMRLAVIRDRLERGLHIPDDLDYQPGRDVL